MPTATQQEGTVSTALDRRYKVCYLATFPGRNQSANMTTIDEIEKAVTRLSPDELGRLRAWIEQLQATEFDNQIERDILAGKLDWLAEEALAEHAAGKTRKIR